MIVSLQDVRPPSLRAACGLGSGARHKEIFEANRPMLKDPDKIYPGQVLRIPAK